MPQTKNLTSQLQVSLSKRMLIGAGISLLLISYFMLSVDEPDPAWGKFWMIRPLIIVPLAGAIGGLCNYFIVLYHDRMGVNKIIAVILSAIVFIVGLWMGIVLGLAGTMWN